MESLTQSYDVRNVPEGEYLIYITSYNRYIRIYQKVNKQLIFIVSNNIIADQEELKNKDFFRATNDREQLYYCIDIYECLNKIGWTSFDR